MKTTLKPATLVAINSAMLFSVGCDEEVRVATQPESKTIIMKESPVEQRMGVDFFSDEPLRQKSVTVYYLVAEDGTVAEVGLSDFAKTKIGDQYAARSWETK